jgi:sugar phosphate isomerase/epimerase
MNRNQFLKAAAATTASLATGCKTLSLNADKKLALGFDNFSIRACKWQAPRLLEYAAKQKVDTVLFSDLDVYASHEESYLREVRAQADELGIAMQAGTGSICGTASNFNDKHGTDVEHLRLTLRIAHAVGAKVARCYLGSGKDRKSKGGLLPHMDRVVFVCKEVESYARELGVKIAIENHAGDMTGHQLKTLIERAGPDYVGATIDAGNAAFTLEDPIENLRILGPYVLSSGIRDTAVGMTPQGVKAWWRPMGQGHVDWLEYFALWQQLCPHAPVQLEIISQWGKTIPPKSNEKYWQHYQDIRDQDYARFLAWAKTGTPPGEPPEDRFTAEFQLRELEQSLAYCRNELGL